MPGDQHSSIVLSRRNPPARNLMALNFSIVFLALVVACEPKQATPPSGVLWVDPGQDLGLISKLVFGVNTGPWSDLGPNNIEPFKQLSPGFLRWPGGEWGDRNEITTRQIDNYIAQARMAGAEPSIVVRVPGGSPELAASIVKYVNVDKKYAVRYWAIGNEPSLYHKAFEGYSTERYNQEWREFATAMKAVDPTILIYGPEIHQFKGDENFDPRDNENRLYLQEFLKANGDLVDIVTVHRYPFPTCTTCGDPTWEQLRDNTPEWDNIIPNLRKIAREITGKDLPVGVTEFNSNYASSAGGETSPNSFNNAIWLADILGRMIRQRPEMLAYWMLKNNSGGHGLMDSFNLKPTYYVYQLYKRFGSHLLAANSDEQYVSVFAARTDDDAVTVILVNRGPEVRKTFRLEKGDDYKLAEAYLFDSSHQAEQITPPAFQNNGLIVVPEKSVTLLVFR